MWEWAEKLSVPPGKLCTCEDVSQTATSQPDLAQTQLPEGSEHKNGLCGHMQDTASKRDGPLILAGCYCLKQDLSDSPKQLIQVIEKVTSHGRIGEGRKEESKW